MQTVTLSLHRFEGLGARLWAFAQMLFARRSLARAEGIQFWKLLGSGTGEGFTPIPNTAVYAILAAWTDRERAASHVSAGRRSAATAITRGRSGRCSSRRSRRAARGAGRRRSFPGRRGRRGRSPP